MPCSATKILLLLAAASFSISLATHALRQPQQSSGGNSASCIPQERDALLAFKHGITSDPAGDLGSWKEDEEDCCLWRSVQCSNLTGHVLKLRLRNVHADPYGNLVTPLIGKISPSLLALEHLEYLDLSSNNLEGITGRIPEFLGNLKNLKYLNLSGIQFSDRVPPHLGNLSNLQYLDLSNMGGAYSTDVSWLTHLSLLQYLSLDSVKLRIKDDWPLVVNMVPSLRVIVLSNCHLSSANQSLTHHNLTNLEKLDLSMNFFNHPVASCWFWNITSLTYLDLSSNYLYGQLPNALGCMIWLRYLSLSGIKNSISMTMARLNSLCNLRILYLDSCFSQGGIDDLMEKLPQCLSNKLQDLSLESNQLTGALPKKMGQMKNLVVLDFSSNNITGPLPTFIKNLTGLVTLDLSSNMITGQVPTFISQFTSMRNLDLSNNHLSGRVPYETGMLTNLIEFSLNNNDLDGVIKEDHFANIRNLQYIDLSYNNLTIELSSEWQPLFRLSMVYLASCQMGPLFPAWLQWQVDILYIDISSAGIMDRFPHWFCCALSNLLYLNISHNHLKGDLPMLLGTMSLEELYLSSNQITGQVPPLPRNLTNLDISMNSLSEPLPLNFGSPNLVELSLFSNRITGTIPKSICKCEVLEILDLANNFFAGELPMCLGNSDITHVELSNNSLSGEFPSFLKECTKMQFLDLAGNKFFGTLPPWIGNLVDLQFLRLSHNMFSGSIPTNITNLACLKYLDIANNGISGSLPRQFWNLRSMRQKHWDRLYSTVCFYSEPVEYHSVSLSAVTKGQLRDYGSSERIMAVNTISVDLSSNYLTGEIAEEVTSLHLVRNLNLSRNHLTGKIPISVGAMQLLESLDLSRNDHSGEIPDSLSNLTFLSYLDLSYNNLTGRIPSGSQLDTLYAANPSMYTGNIGLCGPPLTKNCSSIDASKKDQFTTKEGHGPEFFYLGLGCGFIAGTWLVFCALLLKKRWSIAYFRLFDKYMTRHMCLWFSHGQD